MGIPVGELADKHVLLAEELLLLLLLLLKMVVIAEDGGLHDNVLVISRILVEVIVI